MTDRMARTDTAAHRPTDLPQGPNTPKTSCPEAASAPQHLQQGCTNTHSAEGGGGGGGGSGRKTQRHKNKEMQRDRHGE